MCRVLRVSQQGYYCFLRRPDKRERDQQLLEQIYACLREEPENANYGVRRIIWWLRLHCGYTHGDRRIYRICRDHNLMIRPKRRPNGITKEDREAEKSENLIKQDFSAENPNEKFLTDITEVACSDGKWSAIIKTESPSARKYGKIGLHEEEFRWRENTAKRNGRRR